MCNFLFCSVLIFFLKVNIFFLGGVLCICLVPCFICVFFCSYVLCVLFYECVVKFFMLRFCVACFFFFMRVFVCVL